MGLNIWNDGQILDSCLEDVVASEGKSLTANVNLPLSTADFLHASDVIIPITLATEKFIGENEQIVNLSRMECRKLMESGQTLFVTSDQAGVQDFLAGEKPSIMGDFSTTRGQMYFALKSNGKQLKTGGYESPYSWAAVSSPGSVKITPAYLLGKPACLIQFQDLKPYKNLFSDTELSSKALGISTAIENTILADRILFYEHKGFPENGFVGNFTLDSIPTLGQIYENTAMISVVAHPELITRLSNSAYTLIPTTFAFHTDSNLEKENTVSIGGGLNVLYVEQPKINCHSLLSCRLGN